MHAYEQRAEADASLGKRLPGVALRGSYARNQYDVTIALPGFAPVTLLPRDEAPEGRSRLEGARVDAGLGEDGQGA